MLQQLYGKDRANVLKYVVKREDFVQRQEPSLEVLTKWVQYFEQRIDLPLGIDDGP